jgi:hypothetical protein
MLVNFTRAEGEAFWLQLLRQTGMYENVPEQIVEYAGYIYSADGEACRLPVPRNNEKHVSCSTRAEQGVSCLHVPG